jgi:hypothetical protein
MSDRTAIKFQEKRSDLISALIDFIKAGQADEREIEEEMSEALFEANKECGTKFVALEG